MERKMKEERKRKMLKKYEFGERNIEKRRA